MITIFTGHYGSGKTEVALNYAISKGAGTSIVDLDIVNPYFRSKDAEAVLADHGIRLVASTFANTNLDLPALPGEIFSVFSSPGDVIFDVGGDDDGAVVLGRYKQYFDKQPYRQYLVVNTFRPLTQTEAEIEEMIAAIEATSRLSVTGLINNSNLMEFTTQDHIRQGEALVRRVAEKTGIPFVFTAAKKELQYPGAFGLDIMLSVPFDREL